MREQEWRTILKQAGGVFREEQFAGAVAVGRLCAAAKPQSPCSLLLEAPTGTGKTLMYLGALAARETQGKQIVVSTSGKLLQKQIAESAQKLGMGATLLMGRANYLCRSACRHYLKGMEATNEFRAPLAALCAKLEASGSHEWAELFSQGDWSPEFLRFARHHLTAASAYCRNGHDGKADGCFYQDLLGEAEHASLVILNHHALLSLGENPLFDGRVLIIDEAHAIPETSSAVLSESVSILQLRALQARADFCLDRSPRAVRAFKAMLEALIGEFRGALDGEIRVPPLNFWDRFPAVVLPEQPFDGKTLQISTPFVRNVFLELNDSWRQIYEFLRRLRGLAEAGDGVCFWEAGTDDNVLLKYSPIETAPLLSRFWRQWSGTVALSATLALPGAEKGREFEYFLDRCGFPAPTETTLTLPSPFRMKEQCMVFVPAPESDFSFRMERDPEAFLRARIELAGGLIGAFGGRTLALYTALSRMECAGWVLKQLFPDQILAQGDDGATNDELAGRFVRDPRCVLLGTRTFFQGFDAPGETLSCEILEKLPFGRRNDPVLDEQIRRAGDRWFEKIVLPAMLMELRQAFGRLIRSEQDRGIFVLADSRFLQRDYRNAVEKALAGAEINLFFSAEDLLKRIPAGFLPFLRGGLPADFPERFSEVWNRFRETSLFHRISGVQPQEAVLRKLKVRRLYPWQKKIVGEVLAGVPSQLIIYPAGSGKSLTFQIPALMRPGLTLVVSPLKALMYDQVKSLQEKGIREVDYLNSDRSFEERRRIFERLRSGEVRLLYVAPERLHRSFISLLQALPQGIAMLVIDEAHMISEAGTQWRPFYGELPNAWHLLKRPQLLVLTATAGPAIRKELQKQFEIPDERVYENPVVRSRVRLKVNLIHNVREHFDKVEQFLMMAAGKPVLIYCSRVKYVRSLYQFLREGRSGLPVSCAMYYTGDGGKAGWLLSPDELRRNHLDFLENRIQVLIATSAYGMGIDKPDIWGILYNNIPSSLEELVQGAGRVCRDRELLRRYSEEGHPATVCVTCNSMNDLKRPFRTMIDAPFKELRETGIAVMWNLLFKTNRFACWNDDETPDENMVRACVLVARYLRSCSPQPKVKESYLDWSTSEFSFVGVEPLDAVADLAGFEAMLENQRIKQIQQFADVMLFCRTDGCRNEFLREHFSGVSTETLSCHYCDHCGLNLPAHLAYADSISSTFEEAPSFFEAGRFLGNFAEFQRSLRELPVHKLAVQIAYLHREHREAGGVYSDAGFAALLLEFRLRANSAPGLIELCCQLDALLAAAPEREEKLRFATEFARECHIAEFETLTGFFAARRRFYAAYPVADRLHADRKFFDDCTALRVESEKFNSPALKAALLQWLRQSGAPFGDLLWDDSWTDMLSYIERRFPLEEMCRKPADGAWQSLAAKLRLLISWNNQERDQQKILTLCDFVQTLPEECRREWNLILDAPEEFLKLAALDPELGMENDRELEWFCHSPVSKSKFQRCALIREELVAAEADSVRDRIRCRDELVSLMPLSVAFYPSWKSLIEAIVAQGGADFSKPQQLPKALRKLYETLPFALQYFLKQKLPFVVAPERGSS